MKKNEPRAGYQMSLVLKHGIRIIPVGIAAKGTTAKRFKLRIMKPDGRGKEVEVKQKEIKTYPSEDLVTKFKDEKGKVQRIIEPSVWKKIDELYEYFYNKILTAQQISNESRTTI